VQREVDVRVMAGSAARLSVDGRAARRLRVRMSAATAVRIACGRQIDGQRRTEPSKVRKRSALGARWTYTCWRVVLRGCRCRAARQACVHGEHGREAWRQLGCTQASCCGACIRPCENCLIHKACQRRRPHRRVIFARPITLIIVFAPVHNQVVNIRRVSKKVVNIRRVYRIKGPA
jgi:ferredoxin